ncbi:MAG: AAA-like domain-containing protein [Lewinellaceae bacterium]|nr:AAA-like domain-containing protein [Lewinellaceae bacterium]
MKKEFNITGVCYPHLHYMMDYSAKLASILDMVERGKYFIINRLRQYGKTTTLFLLTEALSKMDGYLPIEMNFQGIDEQWHESDGAFARMFVEQMQKALRFIKPGLSDFLKASAGAVADMNVLSDVITELVHKSEGKLVLLIDEVDASSNFFPFLNFLGMLRTKYLARVRPQHATFHSIVLAGVHDIKTLKSKVRPDDKAQYNSPWNIAADFDVEMSFNPREIAPMLEEYSKAEGVEMDVEAIAEKVYSYTSGYPFLVSKLCKLAAEKILPATKKKSWDLDTLEQAVNLLLRENNTNFDSLIKNMENNPDLYNLAFEIIVNGVEVPFDPHEPTISLGRLYGVFRPNGGVKVHNWIYEQILFNYMAAKAFNQYLESRREDFPTSFAKETNELDLEAVLLKFQQYMKEQYSGKDQPFLEREWRLVFLAFLKPIINGKGHDFKEPQVSEEKRLDIALTYYRHKYVIELKRWYGPKAHQKGLDQLSGYLERQSLASGYLIIFEHRTEKTWRQERIRHQGKEIFAVWV